MKLISINFNSGGGSSSSRSRGGSSNYTQQSNLNSGGVATLAMSRTIIIISKTDYIISWVKVTKKKK
ncbi:hypothetical protein ACQQ2T_09245 [Paraclostridium tenue]|nr:hypothetical protein [Paeniclostridium sordellii]